MRKYGSVFFFSFVLITMFCLAGYGFADQEAPDGELAAPPPLDVTGPPDVVVVPSEQYPDQEVYMVPNMEGVYAYQGLWYRNYGGVWFRSPAYNGIWSPIGVAFVPPVIVSVPAEYALYLPPTYHRIHWYDYHRNWRYWARDRYWQRQNWYRNEMRAEIRRDRMRHIENHRAEVRASQAGKNVKAGHEAKVESGKGANPGVKKDQGAAKDAASQGATSQLGKKDNLRQVQKQPQPRQQVQQQPRQQAPKQQEQKHSQPKKQDSKKDDNKKQ